MSGMNISTDFGPDSGGRVKVSIYLKKKKFHETNQMSGLFLFLFTKKKK